MTTRDPEEINELARSTATSRDFKAFLRSAPDLDALEIERDTSLGRIVNLEPDHQDH